ncbi:unnamed protein product [Hymenolepis diminuta]|uniref:C2H2-type domain-containing protein n=1 Tax=Hymenolepis diminuta TaxID=6216 RepID=A0A0R3SB76_HYMDI|nr:unnamed protein product [Hymenolepis diminuta]
MLISQGFELNGHKLTHASKKPHGCRICEKSYSDARSLRRHYENAHPDEYELWRAAEEAETQLSAVVAAAAAASSNVSASATTVVGGGSSGNNLAQQLVAAKAIPFLRMVIRSQGANSQKVEFQHFLYKAHRGR